MDKTRVVPVLATAVMALSLTACQGMMGERERAAQTGGTQTGAAPTGTAARPAAAEQQAVSPDLVRDIQRTLRAKGYDAGAPDGVYGASTEQALRKFQRDQRLNTTGQLDTQTLAALGLTAEAPAGRRAAAGSTYTPTTRRQGAMATPSPDQIRSIQQNLADRGYDPGRPDGRWGPRTQQALRDFERDQDLRPDGRPDPQTLAALGVESGPPAVQTGELPGERRRVTPRSDLPPTEQQALPPEDTTR